ncbi:ABC transporter substrate-binding protein [Thermodesulfobacteriota bacterium]
MTKRQKILTVLLLGLALVVIPLSSVCAQPQSGGTLKMLASRATKALGAPWNGDTWYGMYGLPAMDTLVRQDTKGNYVPHLATSWDTAKDGSSITFHLRKGVKFHDGTDFNAAAVKLSLDSAKTGTLPLRRKSVDVIDDYTVRLNLKQYDIEIFYDLTRRNGMIASPTAVAKKTTPENRAKDHMIGTGPFRFVNWERDNYIKYKKFDGYWMKDKPYLDALEFVFIKDPVTSLLAFKSGAAQLTMRIAPKDAKDLKAKGYEILTTPYGMKTLTPDGANANSPFSNQKVREAIWYAIDRQAIAEGIGLGYWQAVSQVGVPGSDAYLRDVEGRKYDPARAKKLLAEAGYPNGFKTTLYSKAEESRDALVAIQTYLADIGIQAKVEPVDRGRYVKLHKEGWLNGIMFGTVSPFVNNAALNVAILTNSRPYNKPMYRAPGFQESYDKAVQTPDPKELLNITQRMYRLIYDTCMVSPLWIETQVAAQTKKVHDTGWCAIRYNTFTPETGWLSK